ncbi:MAG: MBL fold metallo-hydrolase [Chloroflexales bacterium]|nr:MBL fold metallo-hydrolase [Chloroflexales bacterium]
MEIIKIDDHITAIDHDLLGIPGVGVTYVVQGADIALIETGTPASVPATLIGLERLGIARESISHILCTHIHIDHAGGLGYLVDALPQAQAYIHSMSIPHLIEPTKLAASSRRAIGEEAWLLHGDIRPTPAERLHPAEDLRLDLGGDVILEAIATPGHSPDHLSFWDRRSGGLFTGDAAALAMPRHNLLFPVTPPPTYDLEAQRATIAMLRKQDISRLYITHYSVHDDVDDKLRMALERLEDLVELVQKAMAQGNADIAALTERWLPYHSDLPGSIIVRSWGGMSVAGLMRYEQKRREREHQS